MSLADSIYDASNQSTKASLLEKLVEMAINNSQANRRDEFTMYQLYLNNGNIYYGHDIIKETKANVYRLTKYEEKIPEPQLLLFWDELKTRLPVLDTSVYQISDNLFWSKSDGEVLNKEEIYEKYGLLGPEDQSNN